MKIFLGADHGGYKLKEKIKVWLEKKGYEVEDEGAYEYNKRDDFVDFGKRVAEKIVSESEDVRGVVFCKNGVGMDVVSNRYKGVRCVLGFDKRQVRKAREDDDVNVLSLPAEYLSYKKGQRLIEAFLETKFKDKRRFVRRLEKINKLGV